MPKKLVEIEATWLGTRHRFANAGGDALIGQAALNDDSGDVTIKCTEDDDHPKINFSYRFYGLWTKYRNEDQFAAKTFIECQPAGKAGIVAYLKQAPGIGHAIAITLWNKFASKAVQTLRETPDVAAAACQYLNAMAAQDASDFLKERHALEKCTIDLMNLLDGRGLPKTLPKKLVRDFGNKAAESLKEDPYLVMSYRGCGFKKADALFLALGGDPTDPVRQKLCAWYAIASNKNGDTWHYSEVARKGLLSAIGGTDVQDSVAIRHALSDGSLEATWTNGVSGEPHWDGDCMWLATGINARKEHLLGRKIVEAMYDDQAWPPIGQGEASDHQFDCLRKAMASPLAIIGGGPGCGKTWLAAHIIKTLIGYFSAEEIGVACPTGKAAVRLTEALDYYSLPLRARTIHSLLEVESTEGEGWTFKHNTLNPLPFKVLLVDEVSMLDTHLASCLMSARTKGTLVLLVGDVNQLLPVGHGAPLRDMIAAGVPYGELTEIRRNSGAIVECCKNIREGKGVQFEPGGNLDLLEISSPDEQAIKMIECLSSSGVDPVWDCQVICAVNKNSDLSRKKLNEILQKHFNRNEPIPGASFRLRDKVVNTQNSWLNKAERWLRENREELLSIVGAMAEEEIEGEATVNDKEQIYVANGELGMILDVQPKYIVVMLTSPLRVVMAPRGGSEEGEDEKEDDAEESSGTGCNWELGYALSGHKMQGSEIPITVVMIDESGGAQRVCDRAWIYTAISRAKQHCYMIGKRSVLDGMVRRENLNKRKTFLRELIVRNTKVLA